MKLTSVDAPERQGNGGDGGAPRQVQNAELIAQIRRMMRRHQAERAGNIG